MEKKKIGSFFFIFYLFILGYGNYGKCRLCKIRNMLNEQQNVQLREPLCWDFVSKSFWFSFSRPLCLESQKARS
jgi:hypothetical protein